MIDLIYDIVEKTGIIIAAYFISLAATWAAFNWRSITGRIGRKVRP
jgi:hypothetical protein